MRQSGFILRVIASGLLMIILANSCAVIKTPYFKTTYYQKTESRLDSLRSETVCFNDKVYAGFSRISITPDLNSSFERPEEGMMKKVPIAGFGQSKGKYATGIHDSIFVKAVALRVDRQMVIIITADLLIMPPNIIDTVTTILSGKGINRNQLFFSATHTHSSIGGWGYGILARLIAGKENEAIEKWLTNQILKAIFAAIHDIQPAKLGTGCFDASPYTRNRLTGNPLEKNDEFSFLVLEQIEGNKAVIGSYSAHATTVGRNNTLISADYPGYWESKVESITGGMAMFCGGSMGSQSPVGQGNEFQSAKSIGEALGDSLISNLKKVGMDETLTISAMSLKILLPAYHMRLTRNINLTTGLSNRMMQLPKNVYLQALRINRLIWIFTPGDFSGESALLIRSILAGKGYRTMVSGYNGSYVGYLLPGKYFYLNNYESKQMGWFGPTMGDYTMDLINQMGDAMILCR